MKVRIAVAQLPGSELSGWRRTFARIDAMIAGARRAAADLIVLPEGTWPAYLFGTPADYYRARKSGMPGPAAFLERMSERARANGLAVCAGYVSEDDGALTNAACYIDRVGSVRHVHRKCFLWDSDYGCFAAGDAIEPFETEFGRIGIMICADARLPEIPATLVARGAQLLLQPTAWVNGGSPEALWNPQPDFLIPSRAAELGVPIASADKWGREGDTTMVGESLICGANGEKLASAGQRNTELLVANVELPPSHRPPIDARAAGVLLRRQPAAATRGDVSPIELILGASGSRTDSSDPRVQLQLASGSSEESAPIAVKPPAKGDHQSGEVVDVGNVRTGWLTGEELESFAPARALTIEGVHLIIARDSHAQDIHIRTRAAENRIFLLAYDRTHAKLVDPYGMIVHRRRLAEGDVRWTIDTRQAAIKEVIRNTNIITGRTPRLYEF